MSYVPDESFAAVDLGSNSFHMIVANYSNERLQVIDRLKDMVRLASGLDESRNLDADSVERAIACLERFGERIREIPRVNVRAVGTNTLRRARNSGEFMARARKALGHPIEIIAGREEARLIFLGVARTVFNETDKRLVLDIGGGSTELIIGRAFEPYHMESLYMGCVSMSDRFFPGGEISTKRMRRAFLFARMELESVKATYRRVGWDSAIGASGTILSINEVVRNQGWSDSGITPAALEKLRQHLVEAGHVSKLNLPGLSERRAPVFPGGVAILSAIAEAMGTERITVSEGALREGLLYDLIGRVHDRDIREQSIGELARRYSADPEQAGRVAATALQLFEQVSGGWGLDQPDDDKMLEWAAQVHEIGLAVAHAQHHHHGAYLLMHSDLPGFSRQEQSNLAALVRLHRRKVAIEELDHVAEHDRARIRRLCVLLRLAVLLNRSRSFTALPAIRAAVSDDRLVLSFPESWLAEHPLTQTDLESERDLLTAAGITLEFT